MRRVMFLLVFVMGFLYVSCDKGSPVPEYPKTAAEIETLISKTWNFPESADFISLEFGVGRSYTITSKKPIAKASDPNIYLLSGVYSVGEDLRTLTLADFGTVYISTSTNDEIVVQITPTGKKTESVTLKKQTFDVPSTSSHKLIKTIRMNNENTDIRMTFYWDANKKLERIVSSSEQDDFSLEIGITYPDAKTVKVAYPAGALDDSPVHVTFTLNEVGLATSAVAKENGEPDVTLYFSYNNKRELTSIRYYQSGELVEYHTATWKNGNMTSAYLWEKHVCDNSSYRDEDGNLRYVHDHNQNGIVDDQDRAMTSPDTQTVVYTYSAHPNKAKTFYPFAYDGDFWDEFLLGGIYAGILGVTNANLPAEGQDEGAQFEYHLTDGYPTSIDVKYTNMPEDNYTIKMRFE